MAKVRQRTKNASTIGNKSLHISEKPLHRLISIIYYMGLTMAYNKLVEIELCSLT